MEQNKEHPELPRQASSTKEEKKDCGCCSRRQFFTKVGMGSLVVAGLGTALFSYDYYSPNVLYEPSPIVNLGNPNQYPPDSVTLDPVNHVYIINSSDGLYALSAICTHLGCQTAWRPDMTIDGVHGVIACPCHGSKFTRLGVKLEGPAPLPLPWLKVWINEDGEVMVDRASDLSQHEYVRA